MTHFRTHFAAAVLALLPVSVTAQDAGAMTIGRPYALETPPVARAGAGYLTLTNAGNAPDALIGVEADFPQVMLHESETSDGVTRMRHVDRLEIAPGETVTLAPGGLHVMFMGLEEGLSAGQDIPAVLIFEHAGRVPVTFAVETRNGHGGAAGE